MTIGVPDLRPERTQGYELGMEMMFAKRRVGFDVTYFDQSTIDQIFPVPVSNASGYSTVVTNADDFQLVGNTKNLNPWHSGVALANVTGNLTIRHSVQLVDAMNGVTFGVWDPRLPLIAGRTTANANATTWTGNESGSGTGGNLDLVSTSWHARNVSPIQFITYSEQKFIQAEAEFLKNNGSTASVQLEYWCNEGIKEIKVYQRVGSATATRTLLATLPYTPAFSQLKQQDTLLYSYVVPAGNPANTQIFIDAEAISKQDVGKGTWQPTASSRSFRTR